MKTDTTYPHLLDALHEETGCERMVAAPCGYVLASSGRTAGSLAPSLSRFGLGCSDAGVAHSAGKDQEAFARGLMRLHLDLLRQTLGHAMRHLEGRSAQGTTLLDRQKVRITLADVAVELRECEALAMDDPATRWRVHLRLVDAGRSLLRLLGASGFLADSPGAALHLAEIAGNVYLHQGTENHHD